MKIGQIPDSSSPDTMVRILVLGAGRPQSGEQHTALRSANGRSRVFDWVRQSVTSLNARLQFVAGYQVDEIRQQYPDLEILLNEDWKSTGAAMSMLGAGLVEDCIYYVCYADILFRDTVTQRMEEMDADVVVVADTKWRDRFEGRTATDLARCEKLNLCNDSATRLGPDIDPALADAEFVGLARFSPRAIAHLRRHALSFRPQLQKARLSELIEFLRVRGFRIHAIDVGGDWAELNEPRDLARFVLGTKAQTLHRLRRLVTRSRIEDQVSFTVAEWNADGDGIVARAQKAFKDRRLVARSSALSEDGFSSANAGAYASVLDVDSSSAEAVRKAITTVADSYPDRDGNNQVLVQPMVSGVRASGVAFTRTLTFGAPYYVVNYDDTTSSTESITSGASRAHKTFIARRTVPFDAAGLPDAVQGLFPALREIEELLNFDSLDIEFAISEGGTVHILQVRPIAVNHERWSVDDGAVDAQITVARERFAALQKRSPFVVGERAVFGVMPDWNPAEIIGTKPGRLAMGLYRYLIMDDAWATQRAEYGYRDVRPQPLLAAFAGHPYVDIRASFNSFVPASVPDELAARLVTFHLGWLETNPHLHDKVEFDVVPTCYDLDFGRWSQRLSDSGSFSTDEIGQLREALLEITRRGFDRVDLDRAGVDQLEQRFARIMAQPMGPLDRAAVLLEDCRRHGTVTFSHLARGAFVAITLLRSAVRKQVIPQQAVDAFLQSISTVTSAFTNDALKTRRGDMAWEEFLAKYGHLRPGTYDITSLRYADDPERYLRPLVERATAEEEPKPDLMPWQQARPAFAQALAAAGLPSDIDRVEAFMRKAIAGREYAKFVFTRNLSAALDCLVQYGADLGLAREDLAHVELTTLLSLRTGNLVTSDVANALRARADEGRQAHRVSSAIELPPLLFAASDFDAFFYPAAQPNYVGSGRVSGRCIDLLLQPPEVRADLSGVIAMIPQADPGYDWLFGQGIGGLITMYGGANSHMAIRAAEFGLPAAIGVGEALYQRLAQAGMLEIDAANRQITVIQ